MRRTGCLADSEIMKKCVLGQAVPLNKPQLLVSGGANNPNLYFPPVKDPQPRGRPSKAWYMTHMLDSMTGKDDFADKYTKELKEAKPLPPPTMMRGAPQNPARAVPAQTFESDEFGQVKQKLASLLNLGLSFSQQSQAQTPPQPQAQTPPQPPVQAPPPQQPQAPPQPQVKAPPVQAPPQTPANTKDANIIKRAVELRLGSKRASGSGSGKRRAPTPALKNKVSPVKNISEALQIVEPSASKQASDASTVQQLATSKAGRPLTKNKPGDLIYGRG